MQHKKGQNPYFKLKDIAKTFGITKALSGVTLDIYAGEVIGLVGPNGAGKSTLMKILTGILPQTDGTIEIEGRTEEHYNTKLAKKYGVACAYQDLSLCTNLSVYENFALLNVSHKIVDKPGWRTQAKKNAKELLEKYFPGNGIDVTKPVSKLSLADQQVVEICKTLMTDNLKILILDEPTSALSTDKAGQLHKVVEELSQKGVAVIYISHKLDEIGIVSDRIVILRNGQNVGEFSSKEVTQDDLIGLMGGEKKEKKEHTAKENIIGANLVEIKGLTTNVLNNINIHIKKGEIVGISGLAGSGQQELLQAIYSAKSHIGTAGKNGVQINSTIAYVSGDRTKEGVFPLWDIRNNILIANLDRVKGKILLNKKECDDSANYWYDKLKFRAEGIESNIMSLSGGNQQKALIARGIASEADIIILNDPTAGVDIGTKQDIYALLDEVKRMGKAVILYSTEDAEIEICDRAYIMHEGAITEELKGEDITVSNVFLKVPAMITTLATGYLFYTVILVVSSKWSSIPAKGFVKFVNKNLIGINMMTIVCIVVAVILWFLLYRTKYGHQLHAVGQKREAARLAGIHVGKTVIIAFVINGALCGLAGAMAAAYCGGANQDLGTTYFLPSVAAAFVGGTNAAGGKSSVVGVSIGALMMTLMSTFLNAAKLDVGVQRLIQGVFLVFLLVVAVSDASKKK